MPQPTNNQTVSRYNLFRQKVAAFFDLPTSWPAKLVQLLIVVLILASAAEFVVEIFWLNYFQTHHYFFYQLELVIVAVFTLEYLIRFWAAGSRWHFIFNFYSLIDFVAVFPFYLVAFNFSFLRATRIIRILRLARLLRLAKLTKYSSGITTTHIVQENFVKNLIVIILLVYLVEPVKAFLKNVSPDFYGDIMLATSVLAVAAMFGMFAMSYESVNPHKTFDRLFAHFTSGMLLLPIGMMFLILQEALTMEINQSPVVLMLAIWLVYFAIVLWDFWNVKRSEGNILAAEEAAEKR